ncbi:MAG: 4Fe-4S dicluster domain-containing protein [Candidatus Azobacteroides sp.]|nr:4Fe-4S dicluster domain-containing protein [Candidatus Azobacteroides sp.]
MLKKIRIGASIVFFTLITFYFIDFREVLPHRFHILEEIQFIPALLAVNLIILLAILLFTFLFGRIYCSSVCPMGVYQDIVAWFSKRFTGKKKKYTFSKAKNILRWSVLVVTFALFFAGFTTLLGLLDPYSAYGRMAVHLFKPVYMAGNNLLASIFTSFDNYTFYKVEITLLSVFSLIVAATTMLVIGYLAWKNGRTFCNTICPVGTILSIPARYSLFKVKIDTTKCNHCGACAKKCKASCIDSKNEKIDYTRCIDCFNCLGSCKQDALSFTARPMKTGHVRKEQEVDAGKRRFLTTALTTVATVPVAFAQEKAGVLSGRTSYTRKHPISPPGSISADHLLHHCTSCHLCVSKCPSGVLKPAFLEYGMGGVMQPRVYFEKGFCNYDCTICTEVCPNKALKPLSVDEKHRTQMGRVVFVEDLCIVLTDGTNCGACSEHCPTQAVKMEPYKDGLTIPVINQDICVGCGGCEFICPVRPYRAIYVEGNVVHQEAKIILEEKQEEIEIDSFGF